MTFWFRSNLTMTRYAFGPCSDLKGIASSEQRAKVRKHTFCEVAFQGGRRIDPKPVVYVCSRQTKKSARASMQQGVYTRYITMLQKPCFRCKQNTAATMTRPRAQEFMCVFTIKQPSMCFSGPHDGYWRGNERDHAALMKEINVVSEGRQAASSR